MTEDYNPPIEPKDGGKVTLNDGMARSSDLWFYPGEELEPYEMRVSLIGTGWGNIIRPTQKGPSIFVELGTGDNFVFDVGPGCGINYNVMQIPFSKMDHIFLTHLHTDHTSDLGWIYTFGPSGDRFTPLHIYGPHNHDPYSKVRGSKISGSSDKPIPDLHEFVKGMQKFTDWQIMSFAACLNIYKGYNLHVHPLNYLYTPDKSGDYIPMPTYIEPDYGHGYVRVYEAPGTGIAYYKTTTDAGTTNTITIQHWPALHIIDGAISYRLDWKRTKKDGTSQSLSVVLSGDTQPNHYMMEYAKGVDLLIHETAPTVDRMKVANDVTASQASTIIDLSHTPAKALGKILQNTNPKLAVTSHCPVDPEEWQGYINDVQLWWPGGNYQIGEDLMVFNIKPGDNSDDNTVTVRKGGIHERPWGVCLKKNTLKGCTMKVEEISDYQSNSLFVDQKLSSADYDRSWKDWATGDYQNGTSRQQLYCPDNAKIVALEAYNQSIHGLVNIRFGFTTGDNTDIQWSDWATGDMNGDRVGPVFVRNGHHATGIKVRYQADENHNYGLVNACLVYSKGKNETDSKVNETDWVWRHERGTVMSSIAPSGNAMVGLQTSFQADNGLVDAGIAYTPTNGS